MRNTSVFALFALAIAFMAGCPSGSGSLPNTAEVTGVVTIGGAPTGNVTVTFESQDGQAAFGVTDETGRYELMSAGNTKGAVMGPNVVRIETVLDAPPPPGYKDPIPSKFNKDSELKVNVEAGKNTHNFDL